MFVGWDTLEVPTYRHEAFAAYQSGREFDESLLEQLAMLPAALHGARLPRREGARLRGGRLPRRRGRVRGGRGGTVLVASGDRDAFQLVSERTTVIQPMRGVSEIARIGPDEVRERYGVEPSQVPDFIALRGDPSDKLPGRERRRPEDGREPPARSTTRSRRCSTTGASLRRRTSCASTAASRRWTPGRRCRTFPTPSPTGKAARRSLAPGD